MGKFENTDLIDSQDTNVFDNIVSLYVSEKVQERNSDFSIKHAEYRWIHVLQHSRDNNLNHSFFRKIVEYVLRLPATNAPVEQIISSTNSNLWMTEKTQF